MSIRTLGLSDQLRDYLLSVSVVHDPLLQRLRDETMKAVGFNMQISPEQAQFMTVLLKLMNARRVLEVGTFTGFSALSIARALPQDGHLITCDIETDWTAIGRRYWQEAGVDGKIDLRIAPAVETLDGLVESGYAETFDFAFIDADKQNYVAYYEKCLRLIRPGGVIGIDNTLWGGAVADLNDNDADTVAIREVNRLIFEDARVDSSLLPIGDGLHLAYKRALSR